MARKRNRSLADEATALGVFRVQIKENGKIVGDSGWKKNQITDLGARYYLVENLVGAAGSQRVTHMGIGTGAAPAAADTSLSGETASRVTISSATAGTPARTMQATAQWASSTYSTAAWLPKTIQNVGLFYTSSGGSIFAGQTYTTSQWNTNQDVNVTYQIRFP